MIAQVLKNTDTRIRNDMRVNPAFLFAAMFWYPLLETAQRITGERARLLRCVRAGRQRRAGRRLPHARHSETYYHSGARHLAASAAHVPSSGQTRTEADGASKFRAAFDLLSLRAEIERNQSCSVWRSGGLNSVSPPRQSRKIC